MENAPPFGSFPKIHVYLSWIIFYGVRQDMELGNGLVCVLDYIALPQFLTKVAEFPRTLYTCLVGVWVFVCVCMRLCVSLCVCVCVCVCVSVCVCVCIQSVTTKWCVAQRPSAAATKQNATRSRRFSIIPRWQQLTRKNVQQTIKSKSPGLYFVAPDKESFQKNQGSSN